MDFINLENINNAFFTIIQTSSLQMSILGDFLMATVARLGKYVIKDLKENREFVGNLHFAKSENEIVTIENSYEDSWSTTLPEKNLVELLNKWDKLLKLPIWPKKAIITMDDDYNFEIKYEVNGIEKVI